MSPPAAAAVVVVVATFRRAFLPLFFLLVASSSSSRWSSSSSTGVSAFSPSSSSKLFRPTSKLAGVGVGVGAGAGVDGESGRSTLFDLPAVFRKSDERPVVLFDGKCNLCNAGVQVVLDLDRADKDPRGNLRVAALQSRVGRILISRLPEDQRRLVFKDVNINNINNQNTNEETNKPSREYKSIVVVSKNKAWLNSAACLRIGREIKGPLRYVALLVRLFVPTFLRDRAYTTLSKYRKRLFGETAECRLWDDNWDTRFVDDSDFGGRGAKDPFAPPDAEGEEENDDDDDDNDNEEGLAGAPVPSVDDSVRVVSPRPILVNPMLDKNENGRNGRELCPVGLRGKVVRVLDPTKHRKCVMVEFESTQQDGGEDGDFTTFVALFYPGQLQAV